MKGKALENGEKMTVEILALSFYIDSAACSNSSTPPALSPSSAAATTSAASSSAALSPSEEGSHQLFYVTGIFETRKKDKYHNECIN